MTRRGEDREQGKAPRLGSRTGDSDSVALEEDLP